MRQDLSPPAQVAHEAERRILGQQIRTARRNNLVGRREIGLLLIKYKDACEGRSWLKWLSEDTGFAERTAQRYMEFARETQPSATVADLEQIWEEILGPSRTHVQTSSGESATTYTEPYCDGPASKAAADEVCRSKGLAPSTTEEDEPPPPPPSAASGSTAPARGGSGGKGGGSKGSDADETLKDAEGHAVPNSVRDAFETWLRFKKLNSTLQHVQSEIDELSKAPGGEQLRRIVQPTGAEGKTINKIEHLNALKRDLKAVYPHSVCPYCRGSRDTDKKCDCCQGLGWVSVITWSAIPDDVKAKLS